ncbi:carboxymuconolactone decarboxylase family protein [Pseudogemmobacter sp. W21_MBD1_M6]|uniref:carboxymuconolactone decarboxylase family protein n=1 Tax=Pseudogemmobacter sp. W21_MBD1_M6 TaxID=3240271 RepID=UPI003F996DF7
MTDPKNPFEAMMNQAADMAKAFNPALESFTPKGFEALFPTMTKDFMEMAFGNALNKEGLDAKTRLLITLAGLVVLGSQAEAQIKITIRHAIEAGATKQEVAETITQMSMFGGLPSMAKASELAQLVFAENEEKGA